MNATTLMRNRLAYTIDETCETTGFGRTRVYAEIAAGRLTTFKVGRRRMVTSRALSEWIDELERTGSAKAAA